MRPRTALRIAAVIGIAWALAVVAMWGRGDAGAGKQLAQLVVFGLAAAVIAWGAYRFRIAPRRASFADQAAAIGLDVASGDHLHVLDEPFSVLHRPATARDVENTAWGSHAGRDVVVVDAWDAASANPARNDIRRFVGVLSGAAGWPAISMMPAGAAAAARDAVAIDDVETESEEFNRAFEIRAADRRFASSLLDARMLRWWLEQVPGSGFEVAGERLIVFGPRLLSSLDDVQRALDRFQGFWAHVPPVVDSWYPRGGSAAAASVPPPGRPDR